MSRSNYNTVEDRDYETRRERERDRARNAGSFNADSRHHGKWTASGEATDLEGGNYSGRSNRGSMLGGLGGRTSSNNDRDHDGIPDNLEYRNRGSNLDRDHDGIPDALERRNRGSNMDRDHDGIPDALERNRSRSNYGSYGNSSDRDHDGIPDYLERNRGVSQYGSSSNYNQGGYGGIPVPPPMPPADFYTSHQPHYRQSHPYEQGFGSHPYDQSSYGYGHPSVYGSGLGYDDYGFGTSSFGHYGSGLGSSSYGVHPQHQYLILQQQQGLGQQSFGGHPSDYYFGQSGYGSQSHPSQFGQQRQSGGLAQKARSLLQGRGSNNDRDHDGIPDNLEYRQRGFQQGGFMQQGRPHTDIYELGNDYIIEIDLPGHQRDHIDIKLAGNELFIVSKPPKREHNFHINERSLGRHNVERKFYLPADVNGASIAPVLTNGVLRLTLPRNKSLATSGVVTGQTGVVGATPVPAAKTVVTTDTTTTSSSTVQAPLTK